MTARKRSPLRPKYQVEPINDEHWRVIDAESPTPYRFPFRYATSEQAWGFADRLNAIMEGAPASVIEDLRVDADRSRTGQR